MCAFAQVFQVSVNDLLYGSYFQLERTDRGLLSLEIKHGLAQSYLSGREVAE